ncbi:hypothetical protein, partial [Singulisphaera acidiphila]|uniref:hypothetical protein n=1 Tax=Singulisphaera acidiphila TaxID=466153 RepID=UPI001ED90095
MNSRCGHCPLRDETRDCPGQRNAGVCRRADASSPEHRPGILQQILNFGAAVVQHISAGSPKATDAQRDARLAICKGCNSGIW